MTNTMGFSANSFTVYSTLLFFSYFPTAANEQAALHIHRKRLTSTLKNKVDMDIHYMWPWTTKPVI